MRNNSSMTELSKKIKYPAIELLDGTIAHVIDREKHKFLLSPNYKFEFNKETGFFFRTGKTKTDDPDPIIGLPEIADIEISTICSGATELCKFCYKSNTSKGTYMTFDTFVKLFEKLPPTITQIAFGIGNIDASPDMWKIFDYCNENGVKPNVTVNGKGITDDIADLLVEKCGAVAVSVYDKNMSYDTVQKLTERGLKQVNIHNMICTQTLDKAYEIMDDIKNDSRLSKLNALVFLSLKKKGRAVNNFTQLSQEDFTQLVNFALTNNIPIGFDSCSAFKFLKSVENHPNYKLYETLSEPCESSLFSSYINVEGKYFPCSFMEGESGWEDGLDVLGCEDFIRDIWNCSRNINFKEKVIGCRNCKQSCNHYDI